MNAADDKQIISSKNVFLVSGFVNDVTNMMNHVSIAEDVDQAVLSTTESITGFQLISAASLHQIEQTAKDMRTAAEKFGVAVDAHA